VYELDYKGGLMIHKALSGISMGLARNPSPPERRLEAISFFIFTVLGFSAWFFIALPFASHRETYSWLAQVHSQDLSQAFSFISKTYRPLAQATTWLSFLFLDPSVFPTSVLRQAVLQGLIYGMFVFAWWAIYTVAAQRRVFALVACVTGGSFFSGYVHLFHIYGLFYVPVMVTLAAAIRLHASRKVDKRETWLAVATTVLSLWHPFATALFIGFYCGFYLDTFWQRSRAEHVRAGVILVVSVVLSTAVVVGIPRLWPDAPLLFLQTESMPFNTRLFGFLVSYHTSEVNRVASFVALLLSQMVVFSMGLSRKMKIVAGLCALILSGVFLWKGIPVLLLWICAVVVKLLRLRCWSLLCLTVTAALLPFGGGIGTPIYALFAISVAAYVTALGWSQAERTLSLLSTRYVIGTIIIAAIIVLMVRLGRDVPVVTRAATPLLAERERTYQLERILFWLHTSDYCGYEIAFAENAGNPIESVGNVITRRNRPPAGISDVKLFWSTVLQCRKGEVDKQRSGTAIVTFGGPALADTSPVFEVAGKYAANAKVWIGYSPK
jgi:hypothetical protein